MLINEPPAAVPIMVIKKDVDAERLKSTPRSLNINDAPDKTYIIVGVSRGWCPRFWMSAHNERDLTSPRNGFVRLRVSRGTVPHSFARWLNAVDRNIADDKQETIGGRAARAVKQFHNSPIYPANCN